MERVCHIFFDDLHVVELCVCSAEEISAVEATVQHKIAKIRAPRRVFSGSLESAGSI